MRYIGHSPTLLLETIRMQWPVPSATTTFTGTLYGWRRVRQNLFNLPENPSCYERSLKVTFAQTICPTMKLYSP